MALSERIDKKLESFEQRLGRNVFMLLTGIILLFSATSVTTVRFEPVHHGKEYSMLSEDPFNLALDNDLQLRIFSPLAGYLLFMRGHAFKYFMLIVLAIFLGGVYRYLRDNRMRPLSSIIVSALFSFSTLTFYQLYFPAYTDPGSFLLILLVMIFYKRKFVSTLLLSLCLFNHESNLFLFPFFFLLILGRNYSLKNISWVATRFIAALVPYMLYRYYINAHMQVNFSYEYYVDPVNMKWTHEHVLPNLLSGIFQSFRLAWLIPLAAIVIDVHEKRYQEIILISAAIIFVLFQFFIAYDISRLSGLAFPALLIGSLRLYAYYGPGRFIFGTLILFIANFFIPAYCVGALEPIPYFPGWLC